MRQYRNNEITSEKEVACDLKTKHYITQTDYIMFVDEVGDNTS